MKPLVEQRAAERLEDLRWMIETGESLTGAAKRLGITVEALEKWCERRGHQLELAQLRLRNPVDQPLAPRAGVARGGRPECPAPCGTERAYQRHYYRGEPIDDACAEAHRLHNRRGDRQAS